MVEKTLMLKRTSSLLLGKGIPNLDPETNGCQYVVDPDKKKCMQNMGTVGLSWPLGFEGILPSSIRLVVHFLILSGKDVNITRISSRVQTPYPLISPDQQSFHLISTCYHYFNATTSTSLLWLLYFYFIIYMNVLYVLSHTIHCNPGMFRIDSRI